MKLKRIPTGKKKKKEAIYPYYSSRDDESSAVECQGRISHALSKTTAKTVKWIIYDQSMEILFCNKQKIRIASRPCTFQVNTDSFWFVVYYKAFQPSRTHRPPPT